MRRRAGLFGALTLLITVALPTAKPAGAATVNLETSCPGFLRGATFTLTANCATNKTLAVPNGHTVNGAGHAITAHDTTGNNFTQGVVRTAGASMNISNLVIDGIGLGTNCTFPIYGVVFDGSSGVMRNVQVLNITRHCNGSGIAVYASNFTGQPRAVILVDAVVSGYQSAAVAAVGPVRLNVSRSRLGPPDPTLRGFVTQGVVQYQATAGGTITGTTIVARGSGNRNFLDTAVLLNAAHDVILSGNTIVGSGTDIGIAVSNGSRGVLLLRNRTTRSAPDIPDRFGIGVLVDPGASAAVACNVFSGWKTDFAVNGAAAAQRLCVMTTRAPQGVTGALYGTALIGSGGTPPYRWSLQTGRVPPGLHLSGAGTITGTPTAVGAYPFAVALIDAHGARAVQPITIVVVPVPAGYLLTARDGGVFTFGGTVFHGSTGNLRLRAPIVGAAAPPGGGYWLVASDGGIFAFGSRFYGSLGGIRLAAPIVAIAATPDGGGYYLVASDGGVFGFGDAHFYGSMGGTRLAKPIVGMTVARDGRGYFLVASDGGVFGFGSAHFRGSLGGIRLAQPIVGMAADRATGGYWLVAADGGVFAFGAPFLGSAAPVHGTAPIVGIAATRSGHGYRVAGADGAVFSFGSARPFGSLAGRPLNQPIVSIASAE